MTYVVPAPDDLELPYAVPAPDDAPVIAQKRHWISRAGDALAKWGWATGPAGPDVALSLVAGALTRDVEQPKTQREAKGFFDAGMAGYQNSASNMLLTGKLPDVVLNPEHVKWYETVASMAGQVAGDLPFMAVGGIVGLIAGVETGPGAAATAGAGALAVPAAVRTALVQSYSKGEVTSVADFLDRTTIVLKETNKNILSGAAMGYAGGKYAQVFTPAAQTPLQKAGVHLGSATAEALTQPTVNAALEGRLPEPTEFLDAGVIIGGVRYARHVAGKALKVYEKTGVPPAQLVADAKADPTIVQDLLPDPPHFTDLPEGEQVSFLRRVEEDTQAFVDHPDVFLSRYAERAETMGGRLVNGDIIHSMMPTVEDNLAHGWQAYKEMSDTAQTNAMALFRIARQDAIAKAVAEGKLVAVLAGGQSAGKTTAAGKLLAADFGAVIDAPNNDAKILKFYAEDALKAGAGVRIVYVDRPDFKAAVRSSFRRAREQQRVVNPQSMVEYHPGVPKAVVEAGDYFAEIRKDATDRFGVMHLINKEGGDRSLSGVGGTFADGGAQAAIESIRERETPTPYALDTLAHEAYIEHQEGIRRGAEDRIPDAIRREIEAGLPRLGGEEFAVPDRVHGRGGSSQDGGSAGDRAAQEADGGVGAASSEIPAAYRSVAVQQSVLEAVPGLPQEVVKETFGPVVPIPGEPTPTTVNYNYIDTPDAVKGVLERVSQLNLEAIQKQRRGVVSWDQTQLEAGKVVAELLGSPGDLFTPREPGTPAGAAEILARKQILVGAAEDVVAKAKELRELATNASPEHQAAFMASVDRLAMIQAEFLGARAEAGRALNILKETRETAQRAKQIQKVLEQFNKSPEELAALMAELDNPAAVAKMAREASKATAWDMIVEGWKASAVSGPITQVANVMGNTSFLAFRPAVDVVASAIGAATGRAERVHAVEPLARVIGDLQGITDGLKLAKIAFLEDAPGGKAEHKQAVPGKAGHIIRTPFRALAAGDALFRTMAERGELYSLAAREAAKEGIGVSTREFRERMVELVNHPTKEMSSQASEVAARLVFNAPLGAKGRAVQQFVKAWHLELAVPFIATPGNVFKEMARLTPAAPIVKEWREAVAKGGPEAHKAIAEMMLGTGLAALAGALAIAGHVSGAGDPDPNKRRVQMASGWQPYSIKLGNTWYSYQRLQPLGTLLGLAADMAEVREHMNSGEQDQIPNILGAAFANAVTNQTFLQGFAQVVAAISYPERDMGRFLNSLAASTVPGALGQTAQILDPYQREIQTMRDAIQNRIPLARESMQPKRDPFGEPVPGQERILGVTPLGTTEQSTDKVRSEAARLGIRVAPAPDYIRLPAAGTDIGKVNLTPEQRDAYAEVAGKVAHEQLSQIVNAPGWDQMPDLEKEMVFDLVFSRAREYGKAVALSDEQVRAETQRIIQELTAKMREPGVE